jgi:hypothetical protein
MFGLFCHPELVEGSYVFLTLVFFDADFADWYDLL